MSSPTVEKPQKIKTYTEFWPFYVCEHSHPKNRVLHFVGTTLGLILLISGIALGSGWVILLSAVSGYFFAWIGHFLVEKNRPATFTYPFWSLISDFKMWALTILGKMDSEVDKACRQRRAFENR
ncbi:MAG: Mpo1-like protein [Pseudobdellovibrionaceae bacterium]